MGPDLPDIEETATPASLSAVADPGGYVVASGARAGQSVSGFPTELLRKLAAAAKSGGLRDPGGDSAVFSKAVLDTLNARMASAEREHEASGALTLQGAPSALRHVFGVSGDMPLPCGHPASMLERLEGGLFMSKCHGCERLDELEEAVRKIAPRLVGKVMWEVRAWERRHHAPRAGA